VKAAKHLEAMKKQQEEVFKFNEEFQAAKRAAKAAADSEAARLNAAAAASLEQEMAGKAGNREKMMQDMLAYTAYLNKLKQDKAFMDAELDRLRQIDQERSWQIREEKWNAEAEARKRLAADVVVSVAQQKREQDEARRKAEAEGIRERQLIMDELARYETEEAAKQVRLRDKQQQAGRDNLEQIARNRQAREDDAAAQRRDVQARLDALREQDAKLAAELLASQQQQRPTSFALKASKWYVPMVGYRTDVNVHGCRDPVSDVV
jgi:hypothetical protein